MGLPESEVEIQEAGSKEPVELINNVITEVEVQPAETTEEDVEVEEENKITEVINQ